MTHRATPIAGTIVVALGLTLFATAADQRQWGQAHSRNMVSAERDLPDTIDPASGKGVLWSADLGSETHTTPIVAGGRVYVGTNNESPRDPRHKGDRGVLLCLDEKDGHLLWQLVSPKLDADPYLDWPKAGIVSSPTVDGDRLYVMTNRAEIVCLDVRGLANGNDGPFKDEAKYLAPTNAAPVEPGPLDADILWVFDMVSQAGIHPHDGAHCSVLLDGDLLYCNSCNGVDNTHRKIRKPDAPSLVVLDKRTGRMVAKDAEHIGPRVFHSTWSSPAMGPVNGKPQVIFGGGDGVVYGFEPVAGAGDGGGRADVAALKRVWRFDIDPAGPKENVHKYTTNRREGPCNILAMPVLHEGRVYVGGGGDLWWGKRQGYFKCIDATKVGDVTGTGEIWSYPLKGQTYAVPAIHEGMVFLTDCGGTIYCLDAATGKAHWTHKADGEIWGSVLVADGKAYVGTRRGEFLVFAAGREKKVLSDTYLDSGVSGTPTAANGVLYVATQRKVYALKRGG